MTVCASTSLARQFLKTGIVAERIEVRNARIYQAPVIWSADTLLKEVALPLTATAVRRR